MRLRGRLFAVGCLFACACACGGAGGSDDTGISDDAGDTGSDVGKYTQTWGPAYRDTTCREWAHSMTGAQQFAASADMLIAARKSVDGGGDVLPPDSLVSSFGA